MSMWLGFKSETRTHLFITPLPQPHRDIGEGPKHYRLTPYIFNKADSFLKVFNLSIR